MVELEQAFAGKMVHDGNSKSSEKWLRNSTESGSKMLGNPSME